MRGFEAPRQRAASTYSSCLTTNARARTSRAICGEDTIPTAITPLVRPMPGAIPIERSLEYRLTRLTVWWAGRPLIKCTRRNRRLNVSLLEECGVARFVFNDFPLGNPYGKPDDRAMQRATLGFALDLLESARLPRTTVQTLFRWSKDESWRAVYARVDEHNREALRREGEARRGPQAAAAEIPSGNA